MLNQDFIYVISIIVSLLFYLYSLHKKLNNAPWNRLNELVIVVLIIVFSWNQHIFLTATYALLLIIVLGKKKR
jgi:phosphoglycerol transferase MdoB-like AlkP superfamily enzyme